ncbi:MAG: hypothetical protein ACXVW0_06985 [Nocardioides sp.]
MPDPFEELRSLEQGTPVNPLPASEVRRRGDRMRRRNNALAALGGVAAVALVAVPLSLAAHGTQRPAPGPAGPPSSATTWLHEVPASVDVTRLPADATFSFTGRDVSVVDDLTLCGRPTWSTRSGDPVAPALDAVGATYGEPGTESNAGRTLAVYADDTQAQAALDAIRAGVRACPVDTEGRGAPLRYSEVGTTLPADDALTFAEQADLGGGLLADLTVFQVARVGNALLVATEHTSAGGPQVLAQEVTRTTDLTAPVVAEMCVFAADPCEHAPAG